MQTLAVMSARHPWRMIAAWLAATAVAVLAIGSLLGGALTTEGSPTNNPQSQRAEDALDQAFPPTVSSAVTDIVVVRSPRYTVDAPQFQALVRGLAAEVRRAGVDSVRTYLDARDPSLVTNDRHATMVQFSEASDDGIDDIVGAVERADASAAFAVSVTGQKTLDRDFNELSQSDLQHGELQFGLPAALIILLLVFGTVVAGLIPLLITLPSIVVALGLVAVLAHVFSLSVFVINMLTGMGLALAIDYSLFVVSRFREERGRGREKLDAIAASATTANRAVVFSGTTFVIAMFGMLIVPSSIMRSLAVGAILVGIVSVVASATLLPALLGAARRQRRPAAHPARRQALARGRQSRGPLLGGDRACGAATAWVEPRALGRAAARCRFADLRDAHRHERRDRVARPLRVEAGFRRAPARLPRGDRRPGRDRRRRGRERNLPPGRH